MFDIIMKCQKCDLCKNQLPLLDYVKECSVFFVGLSAKKIILGNDKPLSSSTISGAILHDLEKDCTGIKIYKTNLVKCLPLDNFGKLRYPSKKEINLCIPNLCMEIDTLSPQIIFLLGNKVTNAVGEYYSLSLKKWYQFNYTATKYKKTFFVPIHHPSYIYVYKRKQINEYIKGIKKIIKQIL